MLHRGNAGTQRERDGVESEGAALAVLTLLARLTRAVMSLSHGPAIYLLTQLSLSLFSLSFYLNNEFGWYGRACIVDAAAVALKHTSSVAALVQ